MKTGTSYAGPFAALSSNVDVFIQKVRANKPRAMATDAWTVKDVLAHIVFWHENYVANYRALAANREPPLLVGPGYRLNKEGVSTLRNVSLAELVARLEKAQRSLYVSIVVKGVPRMTYKRGGHVYATHEFLDLVMRHIATHTRQVRRAKPR